MKIMVMRHAAALSRKEAKVAYDAQRPLSELGRRQAERTGRALRELGCVPNPVVTSPFVRTQESASIICRQFHEPVVPFPLIILAPGSSRDELLRAAVNYGNPAMRWMLAVMHEPDISLILGTLLYDAKPYPFPVREGDLFGLEIHVSHGKSNAELLFYIGADFLNVAD